MSNQEAKPEPKKGIDAYFARFENIPEPLELRTMRRGVRAYSIGKSITSIRGKDLLPEDAWQYAFIGKIAVEWANLEHRIDEQIWRLVQAPENRVACLTAQMIGPAPRLFALIALGIERGLSKSLIAEIEEFKRHAGAVAEERNRFVHDSWHVAWGSDIETTTVKTQITAKGPLKRETEAVTEEKLERVIYKIRRLADIFEIRIQSEILRETGF